MGVNDGAWEELFERHGIAETLERDGFCRISADSIRALREPRLMTKFDHAVNLPRIFAENGLAILPVSRREYVISSFRAYAELPGVPSGAAPRVVRPPAFPLCDQRGRSPALCRSLRDMGGLSRGGSRRAHCERAHGFGRVCMHGGYGARRASPCRAQCPD